MLNFIDLSDLVSYMFENFEYDRPVSIVANKDLSLNIMKELMTYEDTVIDLCEVNDYEYDKEYLVTLNSDSEEDIWHICIVQIYNYITKSYLGMDGYILFHEDVNSKALIDMQKNKLLKIEKHDWFVIGEDVKDYTNDDEELETEHTYTVNGKSVDKKTFDNYISKFAPELVDDEEVASDDKCYSISVKCNLGGDEVLELITDMERRIMHMNDMFREMDNFRRLFRW